MSQKIVIPKGTIDSAHTTIIEIPNYLHETSTVVVTTPKRTDSVYEQPWDENNYAEESNVVQNDANWEQRYDAPEANDDADYPPDQQEQYTGYQYDTINEPQQLQQRDDTGRSYTNYAEEVPVQPVRKPKYDPYSEQMSRRMADKKRELSKLKAERQRMLEGETGTYETVPYPGNMEQNPANLSEVPEVMRARSVARENNFEDGKRRQDFERYQPYNPQMYGACQPPYPRQQSSPKNIPAPQNQQYISNARPVNQEWNADPQSYSGMQYERQSPSRRQFPANSPKRQMPNAGQVDFAREDIQQQQKAKRKPMFNIPRN